MTLPTTIKRKANKILSSSLPIPSNNCDTRTIACRKLNAQIIITNQSGTSGIIISPVYNINSPIYNNLLLPFCQPLSQKYRCSIVSRHRCWCHTPIGVFVVKEIINFLAITFHNALYAILCKNIQYGADTIIGYVR